MSEQQKFVIEDETWAHILEQNFEEYLWNCESTIDADEPNGFEPLSGQPFCGCQTCYTREQLFFLVPRIIEAYKEGKITLA
jgi:hypothetical protein